MLAGGGVGRDGLLVESAAASLEGGFRMKGERPRQVQSRKRSCPSPDRQTRGTTVEWLPSPAVKTSHIEGSSVHTGYPMIHQCRTVPSQGWVSIPLRSAGEGVPPVP